jgi:hypothetical protein
VTSQLPDDDLMRLWKTQTEERPVVLSEIRSKATKFERQIWRRNLLEYAAAVIVVGAFSRLLWIGQDELVRTGAGLLVLATLYVVYRIHRDGSVTGMPEDLALTTCRDFHRRQLVRQRDLLRSIWSWYLLPFVPGLLILLIGRAAADPSDASRVVMSAMISTLVFLGIGWLNQRAARELDREIKALEGASSG